MGVGSQDIGSEKFFGKGCFCYDCYNSAYFRCILRVVNNLYVELSDYAASLATL
jgi:hypothetical protein